MFQMSPSLLGLVEYRHPTADEVRLVLGDAGLTEVSAAALLGVTDRTVSGWLSQGAEESIIPYAAWRLILIELRVLDVAECELACANWWLVNGSVMAESMALGPYPVQRKIGPYTSYRTANNIAAQKNAASFAEYLSDHLAAHEIELEDPDTYDFWESVREEWLASDAVIYNVVESD
jgi:hypothetical protein